jgi:cell division protein FtsN
MGIFIGMILGAIIVAVTAWVFNRNDNPFTQSRQNPAPEQPPQARGAETLALPGKPGDPPVEKKNLTFFTDLPKGDQAALPPATPPVPQQPVAEKLAKPIYLQLAAFERAEQADDLKARLLLMGLDPVTQRAELADGRTVHRIRIGPFSNREDVKAMRTRLSSNGLNADEVSN